MAKQRKKPDVSFNFGANAPKPKKRERVHRSKSAKFFAGVGGS